MYLGSYMELLNFQILKYFSKALFSSVHNFNDAKIPQTVVISISLEQLIYLSKFTSLIY